MGWVRCVVGLPPAIVDLDSIDEHFLPSSRVGCLNLDEVVDLIDGELPSVPLARAREMVRLGQVGEYKRGSFISCSVASNTSTKLFDMVQDCWRSV